MLQLANCSELQWKINIRMCCNSPTAVNYNRKSIFCRICWQLNSGGLTEARGITHLLRKYYALALWEHLTCKTRHLVACSLQMNYPLGFLEESWSKSKLGIDALIRSLRKSKHGRIVSEALKDTEDLQKWKLQRGTLQESKAGNDVVNNPDRKQSFGEELSRKARNW